MSAYKTQNIKPQHDTGAKRAKPLILIIDDDLITCELLQAGLVRNGYDAIVANDGKRAMELVSAKLPDLILLDFMLPDIHGTELCKQIKAIEAFVKTPIIFLTGADDTSTKIEAFDAGAVDYITKPINVREINIRVRTHLGLAESQKEIDRYATTMEKLANERVRQLVHADRLATVGILAAGMAHEINNPATFISGNVQTLEQFWDVIKDKIDVSAVDSDNRMKFIVEEMPALISGMKDGVKRIRKIVDSLKTFARKEELVRSPVSITACIEKSLELCSKIVSDKMTIVKRLEKGDMTIFGDIQQMEQVLVNLIINAFDATEGVKDAKLCIEAFPENGRAHIVISDNGPGVHKDILDKIWDPFFTTKEPGKGTGLGLAISRSIVENHDGTITAENRDKGGLQFDILLPLCREEENGGMNG